MSDEIKLKPCPFCGAEVTMRKGVKGAPQMFAFNHHGGRNGYNMNPTCIVRTDIVFINRREAQEWADAWNRRADNG